MNIAQCPGCGIITEHRHLHDAAHGIPATHMAGTERFECTACGHATHARDREASRFNFTLDKVPA